MPASIKVFESIISRFPQQFSLAFAYGSSVFPQSEKSVNQGGMIDFIFCVDDSLAWHRANLHSNRKHYSWTKFIGPEFVKNVQEYTGAKVYFNTLVDIENRRIKYGVISTSHLIEDLLDWRTLYISGRLHKPVKILQNVVNVDVQRALDTNLQSALHASLLCLPETFSEEQLYLKIADLSYAGDFRMYFGEDKQKVKNIVKNQVSYFRQLYSNHINTMPLLYWSPSQNTIEQDGSHVAALHHLNLLPKTVQNRLLVAWNRDGRHRDMEDVLQSLSHDPECCDMVGKAVRNITLWPSITQSAKGILTAGLIKSFKYSSRKVKKMIQSMKK